MPIFAEETTATEIAMGGRRMSGRRHGMRTASENASEQGQRGLRKARKAGRKSGRGGSGRRGSGGRSGGGRMRGLAGFLGRLFRPRHGPLAGLDGITVRDTVIAVLAAERFGITVLVKAAGNNTDDARLYNALSYVYGPDWPSRAPLPVPGPSVPTLKYYPSPTDVTTVQRALKIAADGKLGPGTAKAIGSKVAGWQTKRMSEVLGAIVSAAPIRTSAPSAVEEASAPPLPVPPIGGDTATPKHLDLKPKPRKDPLAFLTSPAVLIGAGAAVLLGGALFVRSRRRRTPAGA